MCIRLLCCTYVGVARTHSGARHAETTITLCAVRCAPRQDTHYTHTQVSGFANFFVCCGAQFPSTYTLSTCCTPHKPCRIHTLDKFAHWTLCNTRRGSAYHQTDGARLVETRVQHVCAHINRPAQTPNAASRVIIIECM